jgi:bifunctional non-homologous end joining protein LigD
MTGSTGLNSALDSTRLAKTALHGSVVRIPTPEAMLPRIRPMRLSIAKPFDSADHIFELKHDGFRAIAYIENGECKLVSRNLNNFKSFEGLRKSLGNLAENAILDGEVVCLDLYGISQFDRLMSRRGHPVFYAFDLLWLNGEDLRMFPLIDRKERLHGLVEKSACDRLLYAQHIESRGVAFFEEICQRNLEGIVAKPKNGV